MHRRIPSPAAVGALTALLLLGGCAPQPAENPVIPASPLPEPTSPTAPGQTPATPHPTPADVLDLPGVREAIEAEAARTGVPVDQVTVAGYADVTWPDGSLGCPQPGMMYTQALVPGRHLELAVNGDVASYHAAADHGFSYCADPQPPLPAESDPLR